MDRSSLIFIVVPIVIPLVLLTGITLPIIIDSPSQARHRRGQPARAGLAAKSALASPDCGVAPIAAPNGQRSGCVVWPAAS